MNNSYRKCIILCLFIFVGLSAKSQARGYDYLGTIGYVSVSISTAPTVSGYLKLTIPTPRETIRNVEGPCSSYLNNYLSNTVDLYVNKTQLRIIADDGDCQIPLN